MKSKLINDTDQKKYALIFDSGDEVMDGIAGFAKEHKLSASQFTAIPLAKEN